LKTLNDNYAEFASANVALHAITAENDGTTGTTVVDRIQSRAPWKDGSDTFRFPVHSDPEHRLHAASTDDFYVKQPDFNIEALPFGGAAFAGVKYNMVQPALVVVDKTGRVVRKWSWHSINPKPETMDAMGTVQDSNGADTKLVLLRPEASDILLSIKEERDVRTAPSMSFG